MAAVSVEIQTTTYPTITAESRQRMASERLDLLRHPEKAVPPAELHQTERFIFRAKPGTNRKIAHNLDMPPVPDTKNAEFYRKGWERRQLALAGVKPTADANTKKAALERAEKKLNLLHELLGDTKIVFNVVSRHVECFYATDDEIIADYIRGLMARKVGEFENVYEQSGRTRVVVGDQAFPDTELGWQTARKLASEKGITTLEVVED